MPQPNRGNQKRQKKGNRKQGSERSLSAPMNRGEARKEAWNATKPEYGPTIRTAEGMKRGSVERQKNIGEWFQGLGNTIDQTATATDASYGQANAALLAHMNAAQQAAAQSQGQIAQNNQAMTALTGADPSLTAPSLQEGAAAANQRNIAGAALAAPIAQAGASQAAYLRNTGINSQREGISQKLGEAKRRDTIIEDIAALRKEQGEKANARFGELREGERDYKIQLRAFPEAEKDRQLQREESAASNSYRDRELDIREGEQGGGNGDRRERREGFRGAMNAGKNLIAANGVPKTKQEWAGLQALLEDKSEISPQEAAQVVRRLKRQYRRKEQESAVSDAAGDVAGDLY